MFRLLRAAFVRLSISVIIALFSVISVAAQPTPEPDTDDPLYPYSIAGLRARAYPPGIITLWQPEGTYAGYTRYAFDYPSDDLTITGMVNIPAGAGPFPVIILLHGYYDRAGYWSGLGTWQEAAYLAQLGYLTIAPDFRTWGQSDPGANLLATGLVIDTLNLISALPSLPQADTNRIGIWGHSMGGGVATKALVIDERIRAGVLYAPNSANDADLIARWGLACLPGQAQANGDRCNPAEVLTSTLPSTVVDAYFSTAADPSRLRPIAPITHLGLISAPIQIHIGTDDGAALAQTPPIWSQTLYDALLTAGRSAEYHVYPDQGHFLTGTSWATMMQRTADFFALHLAAP